MSDKPTTQMDGRYVVCPWCKAQHGDCWEWVKDHPGDMTCDCGGTIKYWAEYDVTYFAEPGEPPPDA